MKMKIIFLIVFSLIFAQGCIRKETPKKSEKPVFSVIAQAVKRGEVKEMLFYVGDINAKENVDVYPKVSGKLIENLVKENDEIKKGDCLAYIDRDEVGFEFQKAPVVSPIDGTIGMVYLDKGASVTPQRAIAQVVNMQSARVKLNVTELDLPKIKEGQTAIVELDAFPNEVFKGKVNRVSPVVDLASRTAMIELEIPNPDYKLKPGMFAKIKIITDTKPDCLVISRDAVLRQDSRNYAFVVQENVASRREVTLGLEQNNTIEVMDGLSEGDWVIIFGQENLQDGSIVKVTYKQ